MSRRVSIVGSSADHERKPSSTGNGYLPINPRCGQDESLKRKIRAILPLFCLLALALSGCRQDKAPEKPVIQEAPARRPGCQGCHQEMQLDAKHALACTACHGGTPEGATQEQAHAGLVSQPAHPDRMQKACGTCHARQVAEAASSLHFTARNEVNAVRTAFGAQAPLASLTEIPTHATIVTDHGANPQRSNNPGTSGHRVPQVAASGTAMRTFVREPDRSPQDVVPCDRLPTIASPLDLADDLLRRRCLRCHVYNSGDGYPETVRGTGCAACHLAYGKGKMSSHAFVGSPTDSQCLHCHYGNFVGGDYYGRFEHDFNLEYRTPYRADGRENRPYGVEFHQLAPDIHQQKGLACIDCHNGAELMGGHRGTPKKEKGITCLACHGWRKGMPLPLNNLQVEADRLVLTTRLSGKKLVVPQPVHPAHRQYEKKAHCTVCHSQWSFNDQGTHLLRTEYPEAGAWSRLAVQGSGEVEEQLNNPADQGPSLRDKITGTPSQSLWLKGYELRRWESPLIGGGPDGRLQIFRPILDLHLSMVGPDKKVIFDNLGVAPRQKRYLPYTPHTVGKAGAFFGERLKPNLPIETKP